MSHPEDREWSPAEEDVEFIPLEDGTHFSTYDLGLSAALVSVGYSLVSLDRNNPRKVQFTFRKERGLDDVITAYWEDQLQVQARTYFEAQKMLKNRLYSST